ncbi:hypothetical protein GCM10029964_124990 [Kibdelosporangium lantanae]
MFGVILRLSVVVSALAGAAVGLYYGLDHADTLGGVLFGFLGATTVLTAFTSAPRPNGEVLAEFAPRDRRAARRIVRRGGDIDSGLAPVVAAEAEAFLGMILPPAWCTRTLGAATILFGVGALLASVVESAGYVMVAALSLVFGGLLFVGPATSKVYRENAEIAVMRAQAVLAR